MDIKKKVNQLSKNAQIQVLGRMAEHADRRKKREAMGRAAYANVEMARRAARKAEAEQEQAAKMEAEVEKRIADARKKIERLEASDERNPIDEAELQFLKNLVAVFDEREDEVEVDS